MPEKPIRFFSLAEANELVPLIADCTADVVRRLDSIRNRPETVSGNEESAVAVSGLSESILEEVGRVLQAWSESIIELGAHPKGYFNVDFPSADPELLYCWTYGEETIAFTHKVWENFNHRRPLSMSVESLNGNRKLVH